MLHLRSQLRSIKDHFEFYFIEANPKIISHSNVYKEAAGVFNFALTNEDKINITKLFIANNNYLSQGNSIFKRKYNVSDKYIPICGLPSSIFFKILNEYLEKSNSKYSVILRLNCEGVEDDVIYSAHKIFGKKLLLIMGSLKDVKEIKGNQEYLDLKNYFKNNGLSFVSFTSSVGSWNEAFQSINSLVKKNI
jgi:hypothetical protein